MRERPQICLHAVKSHFGPDRCLRAVLQLEVFVGLNLPELVRRKGSGGVLRLHPLDHADGDSAVPNGNPKSTQT